MKKLTLLLIATLALFSVSAQETVKLTVSGQGTTKEEATANALRSAIEQSFGVFVSANTQILNDEVVKDEIATIASGNIQEYKELGCITMPNGQQSITLSATVSIGNLISYAKSKGSSAEFAGQVFAMNMKMRKLNAENEEKAIDHLLDQLAILAPEMLRVELSIGGTPKKIQLERIDHNDWVREGTIYYYSLPITLNYYTTPTSKSFYEILASTLKSISLSDSEIKDYKNSGEQCYIFNKDKDCWNLLSTDISGLSFRTKFQDRLLKVLWGSMMVSMFNAYDLEFVGLGKSLFKNSFWHEYRRGPDMYYLQLTDGRPTYGSNSHQILLIDNTLKLDRSHGPWGCKIEPVNFADFNSVDSLYTTQMVNIVFEEEELYKIQEIRMVKNNNNLLHSCAMFNGTDLYYKLAEFNMNEFFCGNGHYIEFVSDKYYKPKGDEVHSWGLLFKNLRDKAWVYKDVKVKYDIKNDKFHIGNNPPMGWNGRSINGGEIFDILLKTSEDGIKTLVYRTGNDVRCLLHIPD